MTDADEAVESELLKDLDRDGIVRLPDLLTGEQLRRMQTAFAARLQRMRWNNSEGYERTELYRHLVEDVLTVDQGFVDLALHPTVKAILRGYLGDRFELVEAKGWKSLPTNRDFHGWHGDAWYDQSQFSHIPREIKLAVYLTDVKTGAFNYVVGSHRQQHPHMLKRHEVTAIRESTIIEMIAPAGTAFMFDTSGIHRAGARVLEPRHAVFFNYHDATIPLQQEDRDYYRYHPLILNAAFLGGLTEEDHRILGFGNKQRYVHMFARQSGHEILEALNRAAIALVLRTESLTARVSGRIRRLRTRHAPSRRT